MTEAVRNALRNTRRPGYLGELRRKAVRRVVRADLSGGRDEAIAWCEDRVEDAATLFGPIEPQLWADAELHATELELTAADVLGRLGKSMGGGGDYRLLHFLVRMSEPRIVVETGVAAGFTSASILAAMDVNQAGHLWSSDFPYVRHTDPEADIGILVADHLRDRWTLRTAGDRINLPEIVRECPRIDLFHYDSDKSISGREFALELIWPLMDPQGIVVVDDVADNRQFMDWTERHEAHTHVLEFGGKFLAVVPVSGSLPAPA